MAYDEELAERVRDILGDGLDLTEKAMFGGLGFMVNGNMAVAVGKDDLMVRVDPGTHDAMLDEPGAHETVMRGRVMRGWITVDAADTGLDVWVRRGRDYTAGLPPKRR